MKNPTLLIAALAGLIGVAGCAGDSVDDRPPSFKLIVATVFTPSCATASCHSTLAHAADIVLDDPKKAYDRLTDPTDALVDVTSQHDPDASELVEWIQGERDLRMPPDMPLAQADIDLIRAWIAAGAENN